MVVIFIGGWTRVKKPTCQKSLTNTYCCIEWTSKRAEFELTTLVVIGTDCIGSRKSNCHAITATTTLFLNFANMFVPKYQYHEYCYSDSNISLQHLYKLYDFKNTYFWIHHDCLLGKIYALHSSLVIYYDTYSVSEFHRFFSRMHFTDTVYIVSGL